MKKFLVAVDGSGASLRALHAAIVRYTREVLEGPLGRTVLHASRLPVLRVR